jgi:hypothetical protein
MLHVLAYTLGGVQSNEMAAASPTWRQLQQILAHSTDDAAAAVSSVHTAQLKPRKVGAGCCNCCQDVASSADVAAQPANQQNQHMTAAPMNIRIA